MPYIEKQDRSFFISLLQELAKYPLWRSPEEHGKILRMISSWLEIKCKENPLKKDGYVNFMCTTMIKHTHRTFRIVNEKQIFNSFNKESAKFVRDLLWMAFEVPMPSYTNYERLYGLLSLMEVEFERRGWNAGRPDIKAFFKTEKRFWAKAIAKYEDQKIIENSDVE